jgi:hypothetical protein
VRNDIVLDGFQRESRHDESQDGKEKKKEVKGSERKGKD